jgi:hypothetical protein
MDHQPEEDVGTAFRQIASESEHDGDLERVKARANRYRRQRLRVGAGVLTTTLVVAAAALVLTRFDRGATGDESNQGKAVAAAQCAVVNDGTPTFPQFGEDETPHGTSGAQVSVAGSGFYAPASRVRVVWNSGIQGPGNDAPGQQNGPTQTVAEGDLVSGCEFNVTFSIPDVPMGEYPIMVEVYDPTSEFSVSSEFSFEVTG